jgi:uncharacterized protein (DUF2384 family)
MVRAAGYLLTSHGPFSHKTSLPSSRTSLRDGIEITISSWLRSLVKWDLVPVRALENRLFSFIGRFAALLRYCHRSIAIARRKQKKKKKKKKEGKRANQIDRVV